MSERPRVISVGYDKKDLKLSRALENDFMKHVVDRYTALRKEMGHGTKPGTFNPDTFCGIRYQAWLEYEDDFEHRRNSSKYGPLYKDYNSSLNLPQRAVNVFTSKACEALVNSQPFVGLKPLDKADEHPALPIAERILRRGLNKCKAQSGFREAIKHAGVGGEAILKVTKLITSSLEDKDEPIWLNATDNTPLTDSRGRWITEGDDWEDSPDSLDGEKRLKRDPSVMRPADAVLSIPVKVTHERVERNLSMEPVGFENFLCSTTAASIHSAESLHHVFDMTVDDIWKLTKGMRLTEEAKAWLKMIKDGADGKTKADSSQPREHNGEEEEQGDAPGILRMCESWLRFDAEKNGYARELYVLWDIDHQYPVCYNYMERVSPTGKRPFEVERIIPQRGRWWGRGFYHFLQKEHNFVDRQWNRIDSRSGISGSFKYVKENAFVEQAFMPFKFNEPRVWTLKAGYDERTQGKPFNNEALPALDENIWRMLMQAVQFSQLKSGTMTAGDAEASDSSITNTATGINSLNAESDLLGNNMYVDVMAGIVATLQQAGICLFHELEPMRASDTPEDTAEKMERWGPIFAFVGDANAKILNDYLASRPIETLFEHVALTMTKERTKQQLAANQQVWQMLVGQTPWIQLPPNYQQQLRPLAFAICDNLKIESIDKILGPEMQPGKITTDATGQQQAQGQPQAPQMPGQPPVAIPQPAPAQ